MKQFLEEIKKRIEEKDDKGYVVFQKEVRNFVMDNNDDSMGPRIKRLDLRAIMLTLELANAHCENVRVDMQESCAVMMNDRSRVAVAHTGERITMDDIEEFLSWVDRHERFVFTRCISYMERNGVIAHLDPEQTAYVLEIKNTYCNETETEMEL